MSDNDPRQLAMRLARGEERAFEQLYDACGERVYRYVSIWLSDSRDLAADVVQAAFLRAVQSRRRFRRVDDPIAYLFRIARNEAIRLQQKRARRHTLPLTDNGSPDPAGSPEGNFETTEMARAALRRLDPLDREILQLKLYGELTFREIADVLERPQGTVATRYRRALTSLRNWMVEQSS